MQQRRATETCFIAATNISKPSIVSLTDKMNTTLFISVLL